MDWREKKRRKRSAKNLKHYEDFRVALSLPERLAEYLRQFLHVSKTDWDFALDKIRQGNSYREWSKSKGPGKGRRYFAAPCPELKKVQNAILQRFLKSIPVHFCRHGNQEGCSIMTHASFHAGFATEVFSVDIVNAFPTVFRSRIRANLEKPFRFVLRQFGGVKFNEEDKKQMLETLIDFICLHDRLPQGPPTSPRILDIVCAKMDGEIYQLLESSSTPFQGYRFTAWTDDLTISSNGEIHEVLREAILGVIKENGFVAHTSPEKTKYFSPSIGVVPVVTGLVLNQDGRVTMVPVKVNQLRGRLHHYLDQKEWNEEMKSEVGGTLGYISQVYPNKVPSKIAALVQQARMRIKEKSTR